LFYVLAAATPGADAAAVEQAVVAEVEKLSAEDVTEAELTRARNQLEASLRFAMLTARGRASALAVAQLDAGAATAAEERVARAQSLTAADLRRAAGRVLRESGRHVVWVRPAAAGGTGGAR
jgi:zinc protease